MAQEWNDNINTQLTGFQTRLEALEQRTAEGRGIWVKRVMYWLIIIGLIVAIIILATAV